MTNRKLQEKPLDMPFKPHNGPARPREEARAQDTEEVEARPVLVDIGNVAAPARWRYINAWGAAWRKRAAQQAGGLSSWKLVVVVVFAFWEEVDYLYL